MSYNGSFNYSEDVLQTLYGRHKIAGLDGFDNYTEFRHSFINIFDESYAFLFHVFLKFDRYKEEFIRKLDADEDDAFFMADMVNLLGLNPFRYGLQDLEAEVPDIKLDVQEGCICPDTFDPSSPFQFDLTDWAFRYFLENFTVEEMQSLSEEEQDLFFKLYDVEGLAEFDEDTASSIHKRAVFGMHIPQDLKDYHDECAKELAVRIMTNPILSDTIETFLNRSKRVNSEQAYFRGDKDKRFFVSLLMGQMANIWGLPVPIEEDYVLPPRKDQEGKEFNAFMEATFLSEPNEKSQNSGLIFRINAHKGYLPESNENYYTVYALAHEFGHLYSYYSTMGQSHKPWLEDPVISKLINNNPFKNDNSVRARFSQNNTVGKYYGATSTDFTGLPKTEGKHIYYGQYEERHADYVGASVRKMTEFAIKNKKAIRTFENAKSEFFLGVSQFMRKHKMLDMDPDMYAQMQTHIKSARNYDDLHDRTFQCIAMMANWIEQSMEVEREQYYIVSQLREPLIEKRGLDFLRDLEEYTEKVQLFFEMRERVMVMDYNHSPAQEKSLSYG